MKKIVLFAFLLVSMVSQAQKLLKTSNDNDIYNDDADLSEAVESTNDGPFYNTTERKGFKVLTLGYNTMLGGDGASLGFAWASNITGKRVPLYLEYGLHFMYSRFSYHTSYKDRDINNIAFGVPLHLSYKLKYKDFRFMPLLGPAMYACCWDLGSPQYGMQMDFGFRAGWKKIFIEYKHGFDLVDMGDQNQVGISFLF